MDRKDLPNLIRGAREELNITQQDIADKLNVNRTTISRWEAGDMENMKLKYIPKLAEVLEIPALAFIYPESYLENHSLDIEYVEIARKLQNNKIPIESIELFIELINNIKNNIFIDLQ